MQRENQGAYEVSGQVYDPYENKDYPATFFIAGGKIVEKKVGQAKSNKIIMPPLVDSHGHTESSLLPPSQYARLAVRKGVGCFVADGHEIANVCGINGAKWLIDNGKTVPFYFAWSAPSCVPATNMETAGAEMGFGDIKELLDMPEVTHLGELMHVLGVTDMPVPKLVEAVAYANRIGKPVDAHHPLGRGDLSKRYIEALGGTPVDHESVSADEAREKIGYGGRISAREGSGAKNLNALLPLFNEFDHMMVCSDDCHPDYLRYGYGEAKDEYGYIDSMMRRIIASGVDPLRAIAAGTRNPVLHYNLAMGRLREGDPADLIVVNNFDEFTVLETHLKGQQVSTEGQSAFEHLEVTPINNFVERQISREDVRVSSSGSKIRAMKIIPGELITDLEVVDPKVVDGNIVSDTERDILKIVVVNRYDASAPVAVAFVRGYKLKKGAMASSVAHDSHNVVAVGTSDEEIVAAVNNVMDHHGGLAYQLGNTSDILPLPIAGLMSDQGAFKVASKYRDLDVFSKQTLGSTLPAPFMTLSFNALLVIPNYKLSDRGLFEFKSFGFVDLETGVRMAV